MLSTSNVSIIYGTAWKGPETASLVVSAVLQGFKAIDTACQPKHYRSDSLSLFTSLRDCDREDLVGVALEELKQTHGINRESLFIQTKFTPIGGQDRLKPMPYDPSLPVTDQVQESFKCSLKNLKTTYVDSYLLHSPLNTLERTLKAWKVLCSLQDQGVIKQIGVSNTYDVAILKALENEGGRKPQVVQNRWYEGNAFDRDVFKYCRQNKIYYQSFWTLTGSPALLEHAAITSLAEKKGVEPAQIIFRLAQHWGIIPLAGSQNQQHMRDGVEAEQIPLTREEVPETIETMVFAE